MVQNLRQKWVMPCDVVSAHFVSFVNIAAVAEKKIAFASIVDSIIVAASQSRMFSQLHCSHSR